MTSIENQAFSSCYATSKNIHAPSEIDLSTKGLTIVDTEQDDGLLIKDNIVVLCRDWAQSVTIPASVTELKYSAFYKCESLTNVTFYSYPKVSSAFKTNPSNCTLLLTDDSYVYTSGNADFPPVTSAQYSRTLTREWETLVLPFEISISGNENYEFCRITGLTEALLNCQIATGTLAAGTPVLIHKKVDGDYNLVLEASNSTISTTTKSMGITTGFGYQGTFSTVSVASGDGYVLDGSSFKKTTETTNVDPFRGYLKAYTGYTFKGSDVLNLPHVHSMTKTDAVAATCTSTGNIDYWTCSGCGKIYSDAAGETEITSADITDPMIAHDYVNGTCSVCHTIEPATLLTAETATGMGLTAYVDYYAIGNAGQLLWFSDFVNTAVTENETTSYPNSSAKAVLTADIIVNDGTFNENGVFTPLGETEGATPISVSPIGVETYTGIFNGQGHTISGLYYINNEQDEKIGLFKALGAGSVVKHLGITNVYFSGSAANQSIGSIAGTSAGTIENCYTTGVLKKSDESSRVGGICGTTEEGAAIRNCYSTIAVEEGNGVCANSNGTITNCFSVSGIKTSDADIATTTAAQFASGEICYLLNGSRSAGTTASPLVWYQHLGEGGDSYPVLKAAEDGSNTVYYGYNGSCQDKSYSNNSSEISETPDHPYVNGVCTLCHINEPATLLLTAETATGMGLTADYAGYYAIGNAGQMAWLRDLVNTSVVDGENTTYPNATAKAVLTANIDLSGISNWTPIGTETALYQGTFDGNGKSISGMTIAYTTSYQGLFGNVRDATLKNFTVGGEMTSITNGVSEIGGVVGKALSSTIQNVVSNVNITISGASIKQSRIGGVVGNCDNTTVSVCTNNGTIDAGTSTNCIAGIAGYARQATKIENCLNTGTIKTTGTDAHIAGIIAYDTHGGFKGISNCLNTGVIEGSSNTAGAIFGLYGKDLKSDVNSNNYYKANTASKAIGENPDNKDLSAQFIEVTEDSLRYGSVCYRLNGKTSTGTLYWYQKLGEDGDATPTLKNTGSNTVYYGYSGHTLTYANTELSNTVVHDYDNGVCSENDAFEPAAQVTDANYASLGFNKDSYSAYLDYYAIGNAGQLAWFRNLVNTKVTENETTTYPNAEAKAVLTADIDLSPVCHAENAEQGVKVNWTPIGTKDAPYKGVFDGQSHSITGMSIIIYTTGYQGLFGKISNATLKDFKVSGFMSSAQNGISEIGGVAAMAVLSTIEDVVSDVSIYVLSLKSPTQSHIGGVVGNSDASIITACTYRGTLNASASTDCIAGIVGYAKGTTEITNCLNTGSITSSGDAKIAGILGYINSADFKGVNSCLNTGKISAASSATKRGAIYGHFNSNTTNIGSNNYYKEDTEKAIAGVGSNGSSNDPAAVCTKVTETELGTGEVCYKLNGSRSEGTSESPLVWYQHLGTSGDATPVLKKDGTNNTVYYGYVDCTNIDYSNTAVNDTPGEHQYINFICKVCYDEPASLTTGTLQDKVAYQRTTGLTVTDFTYTRLFEGTNWTTWYVPFELELTDDICAHYDFSRIRNVHQYDDNGDGDVDRTVIETFRQKSGKTLKANYPYLVRARSNGDKAMTITLQDVTLEKAEANSIDCQSVTFDYTFTGTYTEMGDGETPSTQYALLDNAADGNEHGWEHFNSLSPQRHYLTITRRDGDTSAQQAPRRIILKDVGGDDETDISEVIDERLEVRDGKYLENGQVVIVRNGKKFNVNGQVIK